MLEYELVGRLGIEKDRKEGRACLFYEEDKNVRRKNLMDDQKMKDGPYRRVKAAR